MDNSSNQRQGDDFTAQRDPHDRYFALDDNWYFTTREGLVMGPYHSREQAIIETNNYIRFITQAGAGVVKLLSKGRATDADHAASPSPPEPTSQLVD